MYKWYCYENNVSAKCKQIGVDQKPYLVTWDNRHKNFCMRVGATSHWNICVFHFFRKFFFQNWNCFWYHKFFMFSKKIKKLYCWLIYFGVYIFSWIFHFMVLLKYEFKPVFFKLLGCCLTGIFPTYFIYFSYIEFDWWQMTHITKWKMEIYRKRIVLYFFMIYDFEVN